MRQQRRREERACRGDIPVLGDEHVNDLAVPVERTAHVSPDAVDLHVGLIDKPPVTDGVPARAGRVDQQRREPLHPPEQSHVVHVDTALGEELFQVPVGQAVAQVPADRQQDHLRRETEPGEG